MIVSKISIIFANLISSIFEAETTSKQYI